MSGKVSPNLNSHLWLVPVFQLMDGALDGTFAGKVILCCAGLKRQATKEALGKFIFDAFVHIGGMQFELASDTKAVSGNGKVVLTGCAEVGIGKMQES